MAEPLHLTDRHRLFSATRQDWVPASELRAGEDLATRSGTARIESVTAAPGTHRVFNIEAESEHCFFAGSAEALSHNTEPYGGMPKPHDHHILYEKGIGKTQQALAKEGSEILERYGINHATDAVNRVIAPNIKGQHSIANLEEVLNGLKEIEAAGGTEDDIVTFLRRMGEKAANRR